jgi:hypothetical protein
MIRNWAWIDFGYRGANPVEHLHHARAIAGRRSGPGEEREVVSTFSAQFRRVVRPLCNLLQKTNTSPARDKASCSNSGP